MASQYVNLWSTPGKYIGMGGLYSGGKDYRAVYDSKNNAYWGQHDQKTLLAGIQNVINKLTQQVKDGGINKHTGTVFGNAYYRFDKFNDQQLQEATQRLADSQKYFEGISNNYTKFNDFEKSYDQYRGDWDALFNQTFKNTRIEADNLAKAANNREANENAKGLQGDSSGAVESLAIKPNKTKGTGIKTAADKPGSTGFKTGLGI
jgi:hypothetical protein